MENKTSEQKRNRVALIISGIIVGISANIGLLWANIENKRYEQNTERIIGEDRVFVSMLKENNALHLPIGIVYENKMNQYYDFGPDGKLDLVKIYAPGVYDGSNVIRSKEGLEKFVDKFEEIKKRAEKL